MSRHHQHPASPARRRLVAGAVALLGAPAVWRPAIAQPALTPTPSQTEGPFYPVALPADSDADLLANGALRYTRGLPAWLQGTVSDTGGRAGVRTRGWEGSSLPIHRFFTGATHHLSASAS